MSKDSIYSWSNDNEIFEWEIRQNITVPQRIIRVPFNITCLFHHENVLYIGTREGIVHMFDLNFVIYMY